MNYTFQNIISLKLLLIHLFHFFFKNIQHDFNIKRIEPLKQ